jgi:predicted amino acid-binding ACT domain protein
MSPEVLEKYFDNEGITKKHLGLTSVLIEGVDKHGITSMISSKIDELGGNINPQDNQTHNGIFTWRMVIENLTKKREKELLKFLQTDHGFTKVIVV